MDAYTRGERPAPGDEATGSSGLATLLLGSAYLAGGIEPIRTLVDLMELTPGARVLDMPARRGVIALRLARECGLRVHGVDWSAADVGLAAGAAAAAGLAGQVTFAVAEPQRLACPDGVFDAAICDSAFPDDSATVDELGRVLRPGGRLGVTGFTADLDRGPADLATFARWIASAATARSVTSYGGLLADAGFVVTRHERHDDAARRIVDQVEARMDLVRMTARERAERLGMDFDRAAPVIAAARAAVEDGTLGFGVIVAVKRREEV